MPNTTTTKNPRIIASVTRKWYTPEGEEVIRVSNPEDYEKSLHIKVKSDEAKAVYVLASDYIAPVRTSATEDNLVAVAVANGISEEVARMLYAQAKQLGKKS